MTALCKDYRARLIESAPVAADIRVSKMPVRHVFDCIDGLYFSDDAFVEQFFDRLIELRVAKDMANYNNAVTFVRFFLKLDTFLKAGEMGFSNSMW